MHTIDVSSKSSAPDNKIARLLDEYDLNDGFGAELEERWTRSGESRSSLRELADRFNKELLEIEIRRHDMRPLSGEVDNMYNLLTDDSVSVGDRVEARNRLERAGIDVEKLKKDFVTYQAVRSYLQNVRGATYESTEDSADTDAAVESIRRLHSRVEAVVNSNIEHLRNNDEIAIGDPQISVSVQVFCASCRSQHSYDALLRRGECDCE